MYASVSVVIIGSGNGLSPSWCQPIAWTNAGLLLRGPQATYVSRFRIIILDENPFRNILVRATFVTCSRSYKTSILLWYCILCFDIALSYVLWTLDYTTPVLVVMVATDVMKWTLARPSATSAMLRVCHKTSYLSYHVTATQLRNKTNI